MSAYRVVLLSLLVLGLHTAASAQAQLAGLWEFDDESNYLGATVGNDLTYEGEMPSWDIAALDDHGTELAGVMVTPPPANENRIRCVHGIEPRDGNKYVNTFSILVDVFSPKASRESWRSIFQTRGNNSDDGDFFIRNDNNKLGTAYIGYSAAEIDETRWTRLVVTVDVTAKASDIRSYADGKLVHAHNANPPQVDGRYSLGKAVLLFADDSGDNAALYVGAVAIYDGALTADQVAELGAVGMPIQEPMLPKKFIAETYSIAGKDRDADGQRHFMGINAAGKLGMVEATLEDALAGKGNVQAVTTHFLHTNPPTIALEVHGRFLPDYSTTIEEANKFTMHHPLAPPAKGEELQFFSLQSVTTPGAYLRHYGLQLFTEAQRKQEDKAVWEKDATWHFHELEPR